MRQTMVICAVLCLTLPITIYSQTSGVESVSVGSAFTDLSMTPGLGNPLGATVYFDPAVQKFVSLETGPALEPADVEPLFLSSAETLFGTEISLDILLSIDKGSAAVTLIGSVDTPIAAGLAYDERSGLLYASDTGTGDLVTIDPTTGGVAIVGNMGFDLPHGAAIDPGDGTLYVVNDQDPSAGRSTLYRVDKETATTTIIGEIGFRHINALDFDPCTGVLYGAYSWSDETGLLVTIDTDTGVGSFVADTHRITGLSFDLEGHLYAVDNGLGQDVWSSLYLIDKSSGSWVKIGDLNVNNVLGLVFDSMGASASESTTWGAIKSMYR